MPLRNAQGKYHTNVRAVREATRDARGVANLGQLQMVRQATCRTGFRDLLFE